MKGLLLGSVALLGLSGVATAADMAVKAPRSPLPPVWGNDIIASNNQLSVDFATTNFNYAEYSPGPGILGAGAPATGTVLDSEKGWVPGVAFTASVMGDYVGVHDLYVYSRTTYLSGHTSYSQAPPGPPNTDGALVWDEDFRIGRGFDLSNNAMLTPYLGAGYNNWKRTNPGPGGFAEDYSNGYVGGGLLFQVAPVSRLVLSANGLVGSTFDSNTRATCCAVYDPYTFNLGSSVIFKAGGMADYAFTEHLHANVGVDYSYFKYGQSGLDPAGGVEPNSRTSNVTVTAGLGWAFGATPVKARY